MMSTDLKSPNKFRASAAPPGECSSPVTSDCDLNRVHEELEKLNIATDVINKLELQLDEARAAFREIQSGWSQKLEQLSKKLGSCIEKSRPYYEARLKVLEAQQEAQRAVLRFERANSMHTVAKQQVSLTQDSLDRQGSKNVDPACLEVLNHHIQRVNEAERERLLSEEEHKAISRIVSDANARVCILEKELKRSISKSKAYFDARVEFTKVLEKQKELIQRLEVEIKQKKYDYNTSLRNLEKISEQIHEQRQLGKRDPGVGSETPGPAKTSPDREMMVQNEKSEEAKTFDFEPSLKGQPQVVAPLGLSVGARGAAIVLRKTSNGALTNVLNEIDQDNGNSDREDSRPRAISAPVDINLDAPPAPLNLSGLSSRYSSGVILLASELSGYNWINDSTKSKAFEMPPEDFDVQYKTVPAGVKPFPTPPETPSSDKLSVPHSSFAEGFNSSRSFNSSRNESEASSLASFSIDDESIEHAMKLPENLIKEIECLGKRASEISVDDLPERSSGSGAEDIP